jgi:hypothetical protein
MSTLINQARARMPRIAEAAVERARLSVVPRTPAKRAGRVPFVALLSLLLVAGVAGLLFFNTSMQQVSFRVTRMEDRATLLEAQRQGLQMQLDRLRDPQLLAVRAKAMNMVPPATPAFIRLGDGKVLGTPMPATWAESIRVNPLPTRKPKNLKARKVEVKAAITKNGTHGGAAAPAASTVAGTKKNH